MDKTRLIASLLASSQDTASAFALQHNRTRYVEPRRLEDRASRETTPSADDSIGTEKEPEDEHQIRLTFDTIPRGPDGFVFGAGDTCDIQIVDPARRREKYIRCVSRRHFAITFDQLGRLVIHDFSTRGTIVSLNGQCSDDVRRHFSWTIFDNVEMVSVRIPGTEVKFRIIPGPFGYDRQAHLERVAAMRAQIGESSGLTMPLGLLQMESQPGTVAPSTALTPRSRPLYYRVRELGYGQFGKVHEVVDVSSGSTYAAKTFFHPGSGVQREIKLLKECFHVRICSQTCQITLIVEQENIIGFIDAQDVPMPMLIMEYAPCGNLMTQHKASKFTLKQLCLIMSQLMQALMYLHDSDVAHRDVKPENILISCRQPLLVKLGDFGLAKEAHKYLTALHTRCGTWLYAAPEIFSGLSYTVAVDIWSVGVVGLEYTSRLPKYPSTPGEWPGVLLHYLSSLRSKNAVVGLVSGMLHVEASKRPSAAQVLAQLNALPAHSMDEVAVSSTLQSLATRVLASGSTIVAETRQDPPELQTRVKSPDRRKRNNTDSLEQLRPSKRNIVGSQCMATTSRCSETVLHPLSSQEDLAQTAVMRSRNGRLSLEEDQEYAGDEDSNEDRLRSEQQSLKTYPSILRDVANISGMSIPELRSF